MNRPFALLALVTALAAAGNGCPRCPTVYLVAGSADAKTSYNLLFMGSGFTKEELPTYRQAVQEYADKLLETPAFAPYAGVVNIYRVDLTSDAVDSSHCPSGCGAEALAAYTGSAPLGTPVDTGAETDATQGVDLGSHQCWTVGSDPVWIIMPAR